MAENFQEKTEQPTEKRLEDSRKKGQVAQSRELTSSMVVLFTSVFISFTIIEVFEEMFKVYVSFVRNVNFDMNAANAYSVVSFGVTRWLWFMLPVFGGLLFITVGGSVLQSGFMWSMEAMQFKFETLNPLEGIKKLLNKRSVVEVLKAIIKIFILGYIAYGLISKELPSILALPGQDVHDIVSYLGRMAFLLTIKVGVVFLFIAGLDYMYQKWQHRKDLMMTQQEVKEEHKEREGNPLVKSRIRSLQREMARRRMMEDVKTADVIVTNPTTFAVALKYKVGEMPAPMVVAKGAGFVAARIKELAYQCRVPVIENKPLARGLYYAVKIGSYIPEDFYVIVAELLAEVYKRKGRTRLS